MLRVRRIVRRSNGKLQFLPLREVWDVSGLLADTFPLDRDLARAPRVARQAVHWTRLVFVDRPLTNPERTAVLTLSETPWVPAAAVAVAAAVVAPRLPRWVRLGAYGGVAMWAFGRGRAARYLSVRRELGRVARGSVIVADFVTTEPGAGMRWVADALDDVGSETPLVVLVPVSGQVRRDAARQRLYERRLGFRMVGRTEGRGQEASILLRD